MKYVLPVTLEVHKFQAHDLIAGDPALDFVNTVTGRDQTPRDWLDSYARLLEWATLTALLPAKVLHALKAQAQSEPAAAAKALTRSKVLREALFEVIRGTIVGSAPPKATLALVSERWIAGINAHELRFTDGRVVTTLRNDAVDLDLVAAMIAYRMVEHVLPIPKERLRICDGPNCSWLFIDSSKAGRRRWCDMAVCGNDAKSRRFFARSREQ